MRPHLVWPVNCKRRKINCQRFVQSLLKKLGPLNAGLVLLRLYGFCFKFRILSLKCTLDLSEEVGFCSTALLSLSWCFSSVGLWGPLGRGTVAFIWLIAYAGEGGHCCGCGWFAFVLQSSFLLCTSVMLCWLFLFGLLWLCQLVHSDSIATCPILQGGMKLKVFRWSWRIYVLFIFSQVFLFKMFYCSRVS